MNRMMKIIAGGLVLSASVNARAGVNLIENGDFDSSFEPVRRQQSQCRRRGVLW